MAPGALLAPRTTCSVCKTRRGPARRKNHILAPFPSISYFNAYDQARDTRLGRLVALKILPPGMATDPERKRRFAQEAKAASALNHPYIVTLHDVGSSDGIEFLVMEYVPGKTLDKLIPRRGLNFTTAVQYAVKIV